MEKYGISNGKHARNYRKICKKLSPSVFKAIFEDLFERDLGVIFGNLARKHKSCLSKQLITVILDDSVFRQWLKGGKEDVDKFEGFYGCFFSGQCGRTVFGFKVVTLGVSVNEVFYPLYYELVKQSKAENIKKEVLTSQEKKVLKLEEKALKIVNDSAIFSGEKVDSAISMAIKLVKRFGLWKRKLAASGVVLPDLYFSCDSGYNHELLEKTCENNHLHYISVAKKAHNFIINNKQIKASNLIESVFLEQEKQHQAKEVHLPKEEKTPFSLRLRADYCCKNNNSVVLLIFRLNGSNKVSIIYTTHLEIMSKTLRRHWFARTYIEQFFKILKHVLKIQQTTTNTKDAFEIKLTRFFFVALHTQKLIKLIRKQVKTFEKKGFIALQRILNNEQIIINLLRKYAK